MGKERFEFARIASLEEIAEYLTSLAVGLKRGEVTLESGERTLRLTPAPTWARTRYSSRRCWRR